MDTPVTVGPDRLRPNWAMDPENIDEELNKVPLFMRSAPSDISGEESVHLQAIQSLMYEGTPDEIGENFKEQGNDCFKAKRYQDAAKFYSQGLDVELTDMKLKESLLLNRAAANLNLSNYGKVISDCSLALKINNNSVKALYRAARALYQVDRLPECLDCCLKGLEMDPGNSGIEQVYKQATERSNKLEAQRIQREKLEMEKLQERLAIDKAISERQLKLVTSSAAALNSKSKDSSKSQTGNLLKRQKGKWENDTGKMVSLDKATGLLSWPCFFLYPEYKESDFIEKFDETDTIYDQIYTILEYPPPFDNQENPVYRPDNVDCYFSYLPEGKLENTDSDLLVKVALTTPLSSVLTHPKYSIVDGIINLIILPKSGKFRDEFLDSYRKKRLNSK
ncbi:Hsp70/Hsp90 co-chaperone cns1 [Smittium mucronatum]|uniref:Hsp70/Hsp90 co-chaperone cns1 n=1 Tax=Smittium mucronatum TaxID=133383 RepID=A0A1R0GPF6_9FUNG|nr:Hsp70/Hsp90 co-chaperone cns1 [Smittium mucronatum]